MKRTPRGFTLVELLVVIAIIGVMLAMTIPAVQASRETARRSQCQANLAQVLLALQSYENSFEVFPAGVRDPGGPIQSEAKGLHQGWLLATLPYLDEQNAYRLVDFSQSVYDPANEPVRKYWPTVMICPSEAADIPGAANYAGCHHDVEAPIAEDNHGLLFLNSHIRRADVTDGLAHTLLLAEKLAEPGDLGWMSGTRATLRNTGLPPNAPVPLPTATPVEPTPLTYVGGFASRHPGGLLMGRADGSVQFVSETVDLPLWQHWGHRADGQLLSEPRDN